MAAVSEPLRLAATASSQSAAIVSRLTLDPGQDVTADVGALLRTVAALADAVLPPPQIAAPTPSDAAVWPEMPSLGGEPWLSKAQVAAHLGASMRTVNRWQHEGLPFRRIGGVNRYRVSEVEAWVTDQNPAGPEDPDPAR